MAGPSHISIDSVRVLVPLHLSQHLFPDMLVLCFMVAILMGMKGLTQCGFDLHFSGT